MSVLALVGAKADLASEAVVSEKMAEKFAKKIGATHFQVSAVANTGINQMFRKVSEQLIAQYVNRLGSYTDIFQKYYLLLCPHGCPRTILLV